MKINALKFGLAGGICASVFWLICSFLVMALPSMMLSISGDMMHMQLADMGWHLTLIGAVKGLVAWFAVAGVTGWFLATTYNRLL